jgi:nucleoside-diphosphate-sugar epimerase
MLEDCKILISGCAGQVGFPLARVLAAKNRVYGVARFGKPADREKLEAIGVTCVQADLSEDRLDGVPSDLDYVLHFAVAKSLNADFDYDLAANAEGAGRLMAHCRSAKAFFHCSSAAVYAPPGNRPALESDPLGDHHRVMMPTYSLSKIATETVVRFAARQWNLPTTIARLSVPYGNNGGWPWYHLMMMKAGQPIPVHSDRPCLYNPIHEDDYIAQIPGLLEIASVPASVVNWGGRESVGIEEWCTYLGELTGLEPKFHYTDQTLSGLPVDVSRLNQRVGETRVPWRDGLRRMVLARNPELLETLG